MGDVKCQLGPLAFISLMGSFMLQIRYENKNFFFSPNICKFSEYLQVYTSGQYV